MRDMIAPCAEKFRLSHLFSLIDGLFFPDAFKYSLVRLLAGFFHENMCLMLYANNKGADQTAHQRSLISAFVVCSWDSIICLVSRSEISRF